MKITKIEYNVQKALGTLSMYAVRIPRILSPDTGLVYYVYIDAVSVEDARDRICEIRPELEIYKRDLSIFRCLRKENGEIVWAHQQ